MLSSENEAAALVALDVAYVAVRKGNLEAAEEVVGRIRFNYIAQSTSLLAARVNLIEGILFSYRDDWGQATDKFARAKIISRINKDEKLEQLTVAWMALADYNADRLDSAASNSVLVLRSGTSEMQARCRAATILATLFQLTDNGVLADKWFEYARSNNSFQGDSVESSVIIFDMSVMRVSTERFNRYFLGENSRNLDLELLMNESSRNFDAAGNINILNHWHRTLHGQLLCLMGKFEEAYAIFETVLASPYDMSPALRSQIDIESRWCRLNMQGGSLSDAELHEIEGSLKFILDNDDRAVICRIASQIYGKLGHLERRNYLESEALNCATKFISWRRDFGNKLMKMTHGLQYKCLITRCSPCMAKLVCS